MPREKKETRSDKQTNKHWKVERREQEIKICNKKMTGGRRVQGTSWYATRRDRLRIERRQEDTQISQADYGRAASSLDLEVEHHDQVLDGQEGGEECSRHGTGSVLNGMRHRGIRIRRGFHVPAQDRPREAVLHAAHTAQLLPFKCAKSGPPPSLHSHADSS